MKKLTILLIGFLLSACSTFPTSNWEGYKQAEAIILLDSQLDQIDNKRNTSRYQRRADALAIIRTLKIMGHQPYSNNQQ